jgi:nitrite reductase/ring-hydroxylating ferredoxin subunit
VVLQDYPPLAVFRLGDRFYVIDDTCTHGQASLCDGFLDEGEIECPLHSGRFCIRTGSPTAAPVTVAVRTYQATVVDGNVCVEL